MTFSQIIHYRRSVRNYKKDAIDTEKVKNCLELAVLSPNSSNMQLWEFYHVVDEERLKKLAVACLGQTAASTAKQMVVFITRQDLYRQRAKTMLQLETQNILKNSPPHRQAARAKQRKLYYGRIMPFLYARLFRLIGIIRKIIVTVVGFFRPITRQVTETEVNAVVHKSCALAAQTFMLAMASEGYDTCPMEGFDSWRVKKILQLPTGAGINMIVACGLREAEGVWGERMRIPFEDVYKRV